MLFNIYKTTLKWLTNSKDLSSSRSVSVSGTIYNKPSGSSIASKTRKHNN